MDVSNGQVYIKFKILLDGKSKFIFSLSNIINKLYLPHSRSFSLHSTVSYGSSALAVIASIVSLGSIVVICSWCYKCWKGSEKDGESTESDYDSSSDSQLYGVPGHKYRAFAKYSTLSDVSPPEKRIELPGYPKKSLKFSQPPPQEYDVQAPQPDISNFVIPPEPPLIDQSSTKEDLGKVYFSISYDSQEMVLTLKIIKASGLPAKDFSGTSDPFVKILLLPDKKHKLETRIKRKNLNPTWNEVFRFEGFPHNKLLSRTLYLQVLDYDRFSRNDPIGEIEIPLSDIDLGPMTLTFCKDLQPCKRQVECQYLSLVAKKFISTLSRGFRKLFLSSQKKGFSRDS